MKQIKNQKGGLKQILKSNLSNCHPEKHVYARGLCRNCYEKWLKKNNPDYAKKQKENCQKWHKKYKDKKKESDKKWRVKQDPNYNRIRNLSKFGLTLSDYDFILKRQNGVCSICKSPPKEGKNLHVDHCHKTGEIRGLLCFRCNFGLSYFAEDVKTLESAFLYLKNSEKLFKELERRVSTREREEDQKKKGEERLIMASKTKEVDDADKIAIAKLYQEDKKRLCDIGKLFPQYSRSAISRTAKKSLKSEL